MQKQLRKYLESEKDKSIFDIIIYGSAVKGKLAPEDIDIAVIFKGGNLRERLEKIQSIKNRLKPLNKKVDIKQLTLEDLFSSAFLAKEGIILEGISIFRNKSFSETMGFKSSTLFWYSLQGLTHTQKVKFNYILAGRNTITGIIKEFQIERLANGAVKVPIRKSIEFEEILRINKINYKKKDILEMV